MFKNLLFLFKYSWGISKKRFVGAAIDIFLKTIEPFINLIFPTLIINELTGSRIWNNVLQYIAVYIGCILILRGMRLIFAVYINMSVNESDVKNSLFFFRHFLKMDYSKLEDEKVRDLQQEVSGKVRENGFIDCISGLISAIITLIGFSYIITLLEPMVLIFVFFIIIANFFINQKIKRNEYNYKPTQALFSRKFDYLFSAMTSFDYAKEIRVNKAKSLLERKFQETLSNFNVRSKKFVINQLLFMSLSAMCSFIQTVLSYGYVAYSAILQRITIGEFNLYIGSIYNLTNSFNELINQLIELKYQLVSVEDYNRYIQLVKLDGDVAEKNPKFNSKAPMLEFKNVGFAYPNADRKVLSNISICINEGESLSIVGLNGAGKTTFVKLICRLYEPTEGCIYYYGVDISKIDKTGYYKHLAVVFQDFKIFAFTFLDNVVLNQKVNEQKLDMAILKSGLSSKINALPDGVNTNIYKDFDENGIEFSGGEGQKLVIARAYYKSADMVILDEPTAALDALSEETIYNNYYEITQGKTSIFISHRLASVKLSDVIAVFSGGNIVEYGTHDELMSMNGLYFEMFNKQANYYNQEEVI